MTTISKIEKLTPHPKVPKKIRDRAAELNEQADLLNHRAELIESAKSKLSAGGTEGMLDSFESDELTNLYRDEQALLVDARGLHGSYIEFAPDYAAAVRELSKKAAGVVEETRQEIRQKLESIGYRTGRPDKRSPVECWQPDWIESHPEVRAAVVELRDRNNTFSMPRFVANHQQAIAQIDAALSELQSRVSGLLGLPQPAAAPRRISMQEPIAPEASSRADWLANPAPGTVVKPGESATSESAVRMK